MLFSQKTKGYFVDLNESSVLLARTSSFSAPFEIEDLLECPAGDADALAAAIRQIQPRKSPSGYLHAAIGIYPAKRLVRRQTFEIKRLRDPVYINELLTQQLRIEPEKFTITILDSTDGTDFDVAKATQKEGVFCGAPTEDLLGVQEKLLANAIFPERLELGSVAMLGAVVDYLAQEKSKTPTLVLEVGGDMTHSFIVSANGLEASRPIPQGIEAMVPIVQKELGLKDEDSARKLFQSNSFDFTGMGPLLVKRLLKELQSSIGFYEVQTGQSVGQVLCAQLSPKMAWLEGALASSLGIASLRLNPTPWLRAHQISVPDTFVKITAEPRWFGLLSLMVQHSKSANAAALAEKK